MDDTLIIAIGNVARGDDGVAHAVATLLTGGQTPLPSRVRVLTAVGLDVAMADDVANCRRLIVVDAERREAPAVDVRPIVAGVAAHSGHSIDPPGLLAVAHALYGVAPSATLVGVAAPEMGHGEALSATAEAASREAASVILELLRER
jgi:hydrogenase maturation protease